MTEKIRGTAEGGELQFSTLCTKSGRQPSATKAGRQGLGVDSGPGFHSPAMTFLTETSWTKGEVFRWLV